jgi:5-methylcytosine-specific restriction endonuclease McrA
VCQVIGGGPIPVELAHELGKDAFLKAVLHDGVAIHTVKHFGRHFPAELRSALDLGPVPAFTGAQCADCGGRFGLEYDHINPVANNGETSYDNVEARCWEDHKAKTERDRQAGLLGPNPPYPP